MITKETYGAMPCGKQVDAYTLTNKNGVAVKVLSMGATLVSILVPDRKGNMTDVLLGYDTLEEYLSGGNHVGGTVGRFANRLTKGRFTLEGKTYQVTINDGEHSLHGGDGIDFKVWDAAVSGETLTLTHVSPDGADGYPGTMTIVMHLTLDDDNALHLDYEATTDKTTIVNVTNHAYFNFTACEKDVLGHELWINADKYTATTEDLIPVADVPVEGTMYDFRTPKIIGKAEYDNNFVLNGGDGPQATVWEKESGIFMEVFTDRPGMQIYDSVMLPEQADKNGKRHGVGSGLCLETQVSPDAPNRPECSGYVLRPGEIWKTSTVYRFSVK